MDLTAYTETAQTIDGLTVSTAAASGTIRGGVLTEAGTVTVDAFDYDNPPAPVAIDLDGIAGLDRLANWRVVRGGAPPYGVVASYDGEAKKLKIEMTVNYLHITGAGTLTVLKGCGTLLLVR